MVYKQMQISHSKMRILSVTNLYPPCYVGGYELGCKAVMDAFRHKGHETYVLTTNSTSNVHLQEDSQDQPVFRILHPADAGSNSDGSLYSLYQRAHFEAKAARQILGILQPDVVFFWQAGMLNPAVLQVFNSVGVPIVYYLSDTWLLSFLNKNSHRGWYGFWNRIARSKGRQKLKEMVKLLLSPVVDPAVGFRINRPDLRHVAVASNSLLRQYTSSGVELPGSQTIYWGVDLGKYTASTAEHQTDQNNATLRLLYAGRINQSKGLHIVLQALALVANSMPNANLRLTVAGSCRNDVYYQSLVDAIRTNDLGKYIDWVGPVASSAMPELYRNHDIFVFPSIWLEPFSIALLEAMASGLAVVGTDRGGSAEILRPNDNALVYSAERHSELADKLLLLFQDRRLLAHLKRRARTTIEAYYTLERMANELESLAHRAIEAGTTPHHRPVSVC